MAEPIEPAASNPLADMHLATTPQELFEKADDMFLEAAAMRNQAGILLENAQTLYDKVVCLQQTAFSIQKLGMQDREKSTKLLEEVLEKYKHLLPCYKLKKPQLIEDLTLAVEEGRAHLESIEALNDQLQAFSDTCDSDSSISTYSEEESGSIQEQLASQWQPKKNTFEPPNDLDCSNNNLESEHFSAQETSDLVSAFDEFDHRLTEDDSSEISAVPLCLKAPLFKTKRISKGQSEIYDIYDMPLPKKTKAFAKRRGQKAAMLRDVGHSGHEISDTLLHNVKTPSGKKKNRRKRKDAAKAKRHWSFDSN